MIAIQDFNSRQTIRKLILNKESRTMLRLIYCIVTFQEINRFLEKFFKCLETQNSRASKLNFQFSRIEFRVETVNLHLNGTVICLLF